ncbi:hypothetical protein BST81_13210 [Leptolyngbya sp. 'hensonii']|uniref:alr0857 family protein n=1 Tax=Leptolyngbya sp. 'hensonii' TaxID=1922337 RepID=UPI00094FA9F9|nr:alr0857 family protein [Leptolyngbya sp. 'hensonii']OLP17996.1 hypothetical protein BST81_13210 [Leptolyngbya sp. 'hensonii']
MLKLQYTENSLFMEQVTLSLEALIAQRVMLAVRCGQSLHVQPGRASFLLPIGVEGLTQLEAALQLEQSGHISITPVDAEYVEISLQGTWIAQSAEAEEGAFITAASDRSEFYIYKLWQATQATVSYLA